MTTLTAMRRGRRHRFAVASALALAAAAAALPLATGAEEKAPAFTVQDACASDFKDLSLALRRKAINLGELNKISKDFANAYRVGSSKILMKEPDKFRMDAKVGPFAFVYVINGEKKATRAPFVNEHRDIGIDPGKRQGPLDVGLLTKGCLRGYNTSFVSAAKGEDGHEIACYKFVYAHDTERYELLYVDMKLKCLIKRELFTQIHGQKKMVFLFSRPVQVGPLWVPQEIKVLNADGKVAGITEQVNIKVNTGVEDGPFKL